MDLRASASTVDPTGPAIWNPASLALGLLYPSALPALPAFSPAAWQVNIGGTVYNNPTGWVKSGSSMIVTGFTEDTHGSAPPGVSWSGLPSVDVGGATLAPLAGWPVS